MKLFYCIIILLIGILICGLLALKNRRKKTRILWCGGTGLFLIAAIGLFFAWQTAKSHGLYTNDITLTQLIDGLRNTPKEDTLPDDIAGSIILYYRFGCPDCEAVYPDLKTVVENHPDNRIYWVSSKSEQGRTLLETYPVEEVPAGIYIRQDNYGGGLTYTQKPLFKTDENGTTTLDAAAIERLLYLQTEGR